MKKLTSVIPAENGFDCVAHSIAQLLVGIPATLRLVIALLVIFLSETQLAAAAKTDTLRAPLPQVNYTAYNACTMQSTTAEGLHAVPDSPIMSTSDVININYAGSDFTTNYKLSKFPRPGFIARLKELTGIHFFIRAGSSRFKACLSLKKDKISFEDRGLRNLQYTAISLKIKL